MDSRGVGEIIIYFLAKQIIMPFPKAFINHKTQLSVILKNMLNNYKKTRNLSEIYFKSSYILQID